MLARFTTTSAEELLPELIIYQNIYEDESLLIFLNSNAC